MEKSLLIVLLEKIFTKAFTFIFFLLSAAIMVATLTSSIIRILEGSEIIPIIIQVVNGSIISIAVFELAMVIGKEYGNALETNVFVTLRRTIPRFIGTVCVALSLEGLIMVIKYSQLELAGNLYSPVAIIISAAFLLIALGVFLKLAPPE